MLQQSFTIKGTISKLNPPAKAILNTRKMGERVFDSTEIKMDNSFSRGMLVEPKKRTWL